jgi:cysteinyl-tRNA synthetase
VPYRQKLNFTFDGLHAAVQGVERIDNTLRRLHHTPPAADNGDLPVEMLEEFHRDFRGALADDLNTARALAAVHTLLRQVNTALDGAGISTEARERLDLALDEANSVLDIFPLAEVDQASDDDAEIQRLVEERTAAREARDFARADEIRDQLQERGVILEDTPHGTVWHRER